MKKKILGGLAVFVIAAITMININVSLVLSSESKNTMDVNFTNVEAQADLKYIVGSFRCPCYGYSCSLAYGGNNQWNPACILPGQMGVVD